MLTLRNTDCAKVNEANRSSARSEAQDCAMRNARLQAAHAHGPARSSKGGILLPEYAKHAPTEATQWVDALSEATHRSADDLLQYNLTSKFEGKRCSSCNCKPTEAQQKQNVCDCKQAFA